MFRSLFILSALCCVFSLNAQEWCKNKPAKLDKPPPSFENKLISDRFLHTKSPTTINHKYFQLEMVTVFSPELFQNGGWTRNDSMLHIYSIYNSYDIRYTLRNDLELHFSYHDLILKATDEIIEYGKESYNTGLSIGAKYFMYQGKKNKAQVGIYGQITIPKLQHISSTFFSPELRILGSHPFSRHLTVSYNLGGAFLNTAVKPILLYNINIMRPVGDRLEFFTEFYRYYTNTGPARNPGKRYLFGLGLYVYQNFYCYSSVESGWAHEDTINDFRIDAGIIYRINRQNNVFRRFI